MIEADRSPPDQEIPHLAQNLEIKYRVRKSPSLKPILSHLDSLHILTPISLMFILILYCCLLTGLWWCLWACG